MIHIGNVGYVSLSLEGGKMGSEAKHSRRYLLNLIQRLLAEEKLSIGAEAASVILDLMGRVDAVEEKYKNLLSSCQR